MNSLHVCSQCLRALRQSIRAETKTKVSQVFSLEPMLRSNYFHEQASPVRKQTTLRSRNLATSSRTWQQSTAGKEGHDAKSMPMVPPTTTSTVTSNITATPPEDLPADRSSAQPSSPDIDGVSVSQMQRQIQAALAKPKLDLPSRLAQSMKKHVPAATRTYTIYGETEALFKSCAAQADYIVPEDQRMNILTGKGPPKAADQAELGVPVKQTWWFDTINLQPTFSSWSQVTFLHMYILMVRLRAVDTAADLHDYHRYLIEHFSRAAEDKMLILHNISAQSIRSKYLKDLFMQWRGVLASYDEGLIKGDAVLAAAVWRNLFRGQEDVDWEKVATVVAFMRRTIRKVGLYRFDDLITSVAGDQGLWAVRVEELQELVSKASEGLNEKLVE